MNFKILKRWNQIKRKLTQLRDSGGFDPELVKEEILLRQAVKDSRKKTLTPQEKESLFKKYLYKKCDICKKYFDRDKLVEYQEKSFCIKCFGRIIK